MQPLNRNEIDEPDVFDAVRALVRDQLDAGVPASGITFALTYIAIELGLTVATDRAAVYPVALEAISAAVSADSARREGEISDRRSPNESEQAVSMPVGVTVH